MHVSRMDNNAMDKTQHLEEINHIRYVVNKSICASQSSDEEQANAVTTPAPSAVKIEAISVIADPIKNEHKTDKRPLSDDAHASKSTSKRQRESIPLRYIDSSIHLTTVQRAPAAHNVGCVSLESLIGSSDLELMVQINYMVEIDFVMSKVHKSLRDDLRVIIYHGLRYSGQELLNLEATTRAEFPKIEIHNVPVPGIGTHHTKAMLLFYRDNTMQVVIHTANMIERDWRNKTQAVFKTGRLSKKSQPSPLATCAFERDLIDYLQNYKNHSEITSRISQYDFTRVRGVLIGSVPGKFSGPNKNKWGHLRLRAVLRQQVELSKECTHGSKIICQVSSVGSLGKNSQDWLRGEFEASLNTHRNSNYMNSNKADLCVIYPTAENVRTSYDGWSMGGSLPFRTTSYNKQAHYFNPLLHSWQAVKSGRERAMPHIKTFARVTSRDDGDYLSWFLLTSANLSKPAWGEMKGTEFSIQSYELGVLIFPGLFEDLSEFEGESLQVFMMNTALDDPYPEPRCLEPENTSASTDKEASVESSSRQHGVGVVTVRLPYDLPLKRYDFSRDCVWLSGKYFPGIDDFGYSLEK